jgi:hypothetical protein
MNEGEKNENLIKIYLCYLKKIKDKTSSFGLITKLGFGEKEYSEFSDKINFDELDDINYIKEISKELGIEKSSPKNKADVHINGKGYSIKYMDAAPPSIINHTNRKGFLRVAKEIGEDIEKFDKLIDEYWELRNSKKITEDCGNDNPLSPFKDNKNILKPYLEYFCFNGTGSARSDYPADAIIKFTQYNDVNTWRIYSKSETIDEIWNKLKFCMRGGKGMPSDYTKSKDKSILEKWTKFSSGKYRGALSVRYKSK